MENDSEGETKRSKDSVRSALRAFSIIELFTPESPQLSMKKMSESLALPSSTTVRLVQTLESEQYIRKCENGLYAPGERMLRIALNLNQCGSIVDIVRPHLEYLRDQTEETVCFATLDGDLEVVYLEQFDSPNAIRHVRWVGQRVPVKGTVIGQALTGSCPQGSAISSRSTYEKDVTATAAPIFSREGKILGAINITGPSYRISDESMERMKSVLCDAVKKIEQNT